MGLTGFNRQRKRALSAELGIDESLADKLLAYGYSTPQAVESAGKLSFLTDDERKQITKKVKKEPPEQIETTNELDDEFLALPADTEFPSHYGGGNYYLSNGEKVSGKAAAKKAQDELNGE